MTITESALFAATVRDLASTPVHYPGDDGYDAARAAWNTAVDLRPAAVALPRRAEEVAAVVRAAAETGLRVAPQSTGHAAAALVGEDLADVVLVNLKDFTGVTIDPEARTARVLGGTLWQDVVAAAAPHGLTALHGSAGDVAVAGYALHGGLSFYARLHGLAVNSIRAVELVTADGTIVRTSHEENSALFWAVRGGAGAFGVVTAIELDLLPVRDIVGGMLLWDASEARHVLAGWRDWAATASEQVTTSFRIMHFPPIPELPPFLSGRSVVVVDGAIVGDDASAADILEPLRRLAPELDTFGRIPAPQLLSVHMDPPQPTPGVSAHAVVDVLPDAAVEAFLAAAGPASGVMFAELRQLGGALGRPQAGAGAVSGIAGAFAAYAIAVAPTPEAAAAGTAATRAVIATLEPYRVPSVLLTFADGAGETAERYGTSAERLVAEARRFDPAGRFVASAALRG
ncbi:MAG: FAD-binding oxidoreductase [Microbacteriaceae bacterium]|nr:FAD-binding oxidoreductase [Microbacteriaceae bacterium]